MACCRLTKCCCCSLHSGSLIVAIIYLFLTLLGGGFYAWELYQNIDHDLTTVIAYDSAGIGVMGLSAAIAIVLIVGVAKERRGLCLVWIIWAFLHLAIEIGLGAYVGVVSIGGAFGLAVAGSVVLLTGVFIPISLIPAIITLVIAVIIIIFLIFGIVIVCSYYKELRDGQQVQPV
ncbi:uncharacterized protein LOC118430655 [Branchiostoma floridae]|uniref:Uncharacterized protein LOC118430655 n=1 Tax=Branchiostoma floridae TaxID=7739 RepID=C3XYE4_BRAFL|nr:uncharacterized protein LOC118430655 [Branchiostoma floridae]|eukprot:XP_002610819.1 hypothetical protein BRAFLDRAFT_127480 [Branchiostoma floridae]